MSKKTIQKFICWRIPKKGGGFYWFDLSDGIRLSDTECLYYYFDCCECTMRSMHWAKKINDYASYLNEIKSGGGNWITDPSNDKGRWDTMYYKKAEVVYIERTMTWIDKKVKSHAS